MREADEIEEGMIEGAVNIPLGLLIRKARHGDLDDLRLPRLLYHIYSSFC